MIVSHGLSYLTYLVVFSTVYLNTCCKAYVINDMRNAWPIGKFDLANFVLLPRRLIGRQLLHLDVETPKSSRVQGMNTSECQTQPLTWVASEGQLTKMLHEIVNRINRMIHIRIYIYIYYTIIGLVQINLDGWKLMGDV